MVRGVSTDYTGKCGTCTHFERNGEYRHGWCHRFPYNKNVVCDPKHPYPQRAMSAKCAYHFDGRQTNADRIRAMTDEELAELLCGIRDDYYGESKIISESVIPYYNEERIKCWLKEPYERKDSK